MKRVEKEEEENRKIKEERRRKRRRVNQVNEKKGVSEKR